MIEQRPVQTLIRAVGLLHELTDEWNEKPNMVTCEFAIHRSLLPIFDEVSKLNVTEGKWVVRECETCREHYGPDALHAEIVPVE